MKICRRRSDSTQPKVIFFRSYEPYLQSKCRDFADYTQFPIGGYAHIVQHTAIQKCISIHEQKILTMEIWAAFVFEMPHTHAMLRSDVGDKKEKHLFYRITAIQTEACGLLDASKHVEKRANEQKQKRKKKHFKQHENNHGFDCALITCIVPTTLKPLCCCCRDASSCNTTWLAQIKVNLCVVRVAFVYERDYTLVISGTHGFNRL